MRTYEVLQEKANACRLAAIKTSGYMSLIWLEKAKKIESKMDSLSLESAMRSYIYERKLQRGF